MAFEQNPQLRRLLDPIALQQMQYERDRRQPFMFPTQGMGQQQNQFQPLQNNYQQQGIRTQQLGGQQPGWLESLKNYFLGTPAHQLQSTNYSPNQQMGHEFLLQQGANSLNDPYAGWEDLQNSIGKYYNEQVVPGVAERFSGLGNNSLTSPDFTKQLQQSGQGLQELLAAQKSQYGQQNRNFGLQALNRGLQPYQENTYVPRQPGLPESLLYAIAPGLSHGAGQAFANRFSPQPQFNMIQGGQ